VPYNYWRDMKDTPAGSAQRLHRAINVNERVLP
jgi:hypothetical protein